MQIGVNPNIGFGQATRSRRGKMAASISAGQAPSRRPASSQSGQRGSGMTLKDIGMPLPTQAELDEMQAWVDHEFAKGNIPTWKSLRS